VRGLHVAIRGILFDKDGTLIDYRRTWVPINREVASYAARGDAILAADLLRRNGQDPVTNRITAGSVLAAGSVAEIARAFAAQLGDRTPPGLEAGIARMFQERGAGAVLIEGVAASLVELRRRGYRLGVASNDSHGGLSASLGAHGLLVLCDFAAGSDSGFGAKPDPHMALGFCRAVGLAPSEIAVVGDAVHDLAMARAAGAALAVGVLSGTSAREDLAVLADVILGSVNDLLTLFPARAGG
jgi:phosphoglycolate phosphatase